jgi:N-carbamoyl-L-amino-acid hydrolase
MYDGILGCLAGVEVLRTIHESGIKPYCPIAAIIWTNEYVTLILLSTEHS